MTKPVGDEERARIVAMLRDGMTQGQVAKETGRGKATISRVANTEGIDSERSATKKATETKQAIAEIDRMEIIGLGLRTGAELLRSYQDREASIENIRAYKDLMTGLAIGIDKHRLETGEVTDRTERRSNDVSLEDEFKKLDSELEAQGEAEGAP